MIDFLSSWSEQIVIAIIVASIIEMILPENKNKKYIKIVIGLYILFSIISPFVKNKEVFLSDKFSLESLYENSSASVVEVSQIDR